MENLFTHQGLVTRKNCWCGTVSIPSSAASYIQRKFSRVFLGKTQKQDYKSEIDKNQMEDFPSVSQGRHTVCASVPHPWYKSQ